MLCVKSTITLRREQYRFFEALSGQGVEGQAVFIEACVNNNQASLFAGQRETFI